MNDLKREFEDVALKYRSAIYGAALRITKDKLEAEDLVQDTYLRAYRFFNKFERGTSAKAWLFKILKNTSINRYKKNASKPDHVDFDQLRHSDDEPVSSSDPEEEFIYKSLDEDLMQAIQRLPEEFRLVILLSDVQGFSYKEIAVIVDRPIGTVMSRLHRGRKLLRSILREYAEELGYVVS